MDNVIPIYKFGRRGATEDAWDLKYAGDVGPADDPAAYRAEPYVRTLLTYLRPGQRILDAGCGVGGLLRFLRRQGFRVVGVDASPTAIETLKRAAPDMEAEVANIERLPFPDASFDAYLAIGSWEYPPHGPANAAWEAVRVVKPGGLLFTEVPRANVLRHLAYLPLKRLELMIRRAFGQRPGFSHYVFTTADLRTVLERNGCTIMEIHPHDLPERERHYGLWVDWPFLRARPAKLAGSERSGVGPYELNTLGRLLKMLGNALSPWTIATGMFIVARKRS